MKHLILGIALTFAGTEALADCKVYIPVKEFLHESGLSISFDFDKILNKKNYQETMIPGEASYQILVSGNEEVSSSFHRAVGYMEMMDLKGAVYKVEKSVLCLTQNCSIKDYAKAFNQTLIKLGKAIPACR